jgi:hypothetical protein
MAPSLILSALLSTAFGLIFHLIRGGNLIRLFLLLVAAWIGFAIGQLIGSLLGWPLLRLGDVYVLQGLLGSLGAMILASAPAPTTPVERRNTPR